MSFRKNHVKHRINRLRPKKSIFKMLWFWILVLVIILTGTCTYFAVFYPGLQICNINISGNQKINTNDIKNIISRDIDQKLLGILPTKSILLVNENTLQKDILKDFPVIGKVTFQRQFPQTISCQVEERAMIGVYCDNSQKCFLIDKSGVIFQDIVPEILSSNYFIVRQEENKNSVIGESVVTDKIINTILNIQKDLKDNFQIDIKEALLSTPTRLNIKTGENWQIYFDTENIEDVDLQLEKLNLLLKGDITQEIRKTLQYIDLRFKDRAYYK